MFWEHDYYRPRPGELNIIWINAEDTSSLRESMTTETLTLSQMEQGDSKTVHLVLKGT